jgi:hypothetical protein
MAFRTAQARVVLLFSRSSASRWLQGAVRLAREEWPLLKRTVGARDRVAVPHLYARDAHLVLYRRRPRSKDEDLVGAARSASQNAATASSPRSGSSKGAAR